MKKAFLFFILSFICSFSTFANDTFEQKILSKEENIEKTNFDDSLPPSNFQKTFISMLISLALIIILVFVTFYVFRKIMRTKQMQANSHKAIKILERRALSPKTILYLLEVNNKKILLSESHLEVRSHKILGKEQTKKS